MTTPDFNLWKIGFLWDPSYNNYNKWSRKAQMEMSTDNKQKMELFSLRNMQNQIQIRNSNLIETQLATDDGSRESNNDKKKTVRHSGYSTVT